MKNLIITFLLTIIASVVAATAIFMVTVPDVPNSIVEHTEEYQAINESDYSFVETKNIYMGDKIEEYKVSADDLHRYERNNAYVPGNSNPFTPKEDINNAVASSDPNTTTSNTTNSNNGVQNNSTNKK